MKFSPIFVVPTQKKIATPEDFVINNFGKESNVNLDGALTVNEAVRISRILDGNALAFKSDNTVINGFVVSDGKLVGDDLFFKISIGKAIIDSTLIETPISFNCNWANLKKIVPATPVRGKLLIYLEFKFSDQDVEHRPIKQDVELFPTIPFKSQQSEFNPYLICGSIYDNDTKMLINEVWDKNKCRILLIHIAYHWENGDLILDFGYTDEKIEVIFPDGSQEDHINQGGGVQNPDGSCEIDGGVLSQLPTVTDPIGIIVLYNTFISDFTQQIKLRKKPESDHIVVCYNGTLYYRDRDWIFTDNTKLFIRFLFPNLERGKSLYIFEIVQKSAFGYYEKIYSSEVMEATENINIPSINISGDFLLFHNGILQQKDRDYTILKNTLLLNFSKHDHDYLELLEIHSGRFFKTILDTLVSRYSKEIYFVSISENYAYLVFYNGILYHRNIDYIVSSGKITFNTLYMEATNSIKIIQV